MNVSIRGDFLQKTGGCQGCDDAGAVSQEMIRSGDGYAEFTVTDANAFWMAGLSHRGASTRFNDIDFGFRFNGSGRADVMENGQYQDGDATYRPGDVFRVAVTNGRVQYLKNGQVIHESSRSPQYPLVADVALGTVGATVRSTRIETNDRAFSRFGSRSPYDLGARSRYDRFDTLDVNRDGV